LLARLGLNGACLEGLDALLIGNFTVKGRCAHMFPNESRSEEHGGENHGPHEILREAVQLQGFL
jgi:hypothetical protein